MPHFKPRGKNKPSENKKQSYRERNNIDDVCKDHCHHLYELTRWRLRETWHTENLPCLRLAQLPSQPHAPVPNFLTCLLSLITGDSPVTDTWAWSSAVLDSCCQLPRRTGIRAALRRTHEWMINDKNLTTLILLSTYLCLITSLTEVLRITRDWRRH